MERKLATILFADLVGSTELGASIDPEHARDLLERFYDAMAAEIARADLASHGVRVVTVYPGPVKSALEQGARDAYGGGGIFGRLAPTGDPDTLAARVLTAIEHDEPRVIYPKVYGLGWVAPNFSRWVALDHGPPPVQ